MSTCPIPIASLADQLIKHIDPKSPPPLRLMAARGMVPMGPKDMVTVLSCLCFDPVENIAQSAVKSLAELPDRIVRGALGEKLEPSVLDHLAHSFPEKPEYIETILLNDQTPDESFAWLGSLVNERLLQIISENQVRILRHPPIAKAILANPNVRQSAVDRLMDFAVRTGMQFEGVEAFEQAKKRILSTPTDPQEEERIQNIVEASLPEDMLTEDNDASDPDESEEHHAVKKSILARLSSMTSSQKVALAQKGNKTIRMTLIKDPNKVIATTAIKNPGITESEVLSVATSRSVADEVIRIVAGNREWTRSYAVKLALVQNPKTPIAFAMRFLSSIRAGDLKKIASSKNIPNAVATSAKQMLQKKSPR